ncbi:MAG: hypothetical protein MUP76_07730, partial [Acidimicrobiia bacterium]|nr:hypothetical protein [Acidimicrobiia bacterium]
LSSDPIAMCELLVGLGEVTVLDVTAVGLSTPAPTPVYSGRRNEEPGMRRRVIAGAVVAAFGYVSVAPRGAATGTSGPDLTKPRHEEGQ